VVLKKTPSAVMGRQLLGCGNTKQGGKDFEGVTEIAVSSL